VLGSEATEDLQLLIWSWRCTDGSFNYFLMGKIGDDNGTDYGAASE
ncbi:hypothetical protein LINPERHAP1_LOCUS19796, partial [Linum perenne]